MIKKITLFFMLWGASSLTLAHTGLWTDSVAMEGETLYTNIVTGHGCGYADKPSLPVIAQSIVFPNGPNPLIVRKGTEQPVNLADVLEGGQHAAAIINPGIILNDDPFDTIIPFEDSATGVLRAIHYRDGVMPPWAAAHNPISFSGVTFVAESCATQVVARLGIANWCHHRAGNRRGDIWIGKTTPVFNDADIVSVGFWPTLTYKRNLEENPLPESCGEGFTVLITPSGAAIDQYLPMSGFIAGGPTEGEGGGE